jgi:hypothetical protein
MPAFDSNLHSHDSDNYCKNSPLGSFSQEYRAGPVQVHKYKSRREQSALELSSKAGRVQEGGGVVGGDGGTGKSLVVLTLRTCDGTALRQRLIGLRQRRATIVLQYI